MNTKLFYGVPFYTMDAERSVIEAVVIEGDTIKYTAENREEAHNLFPGAELVEINGGCILPGFVDAHLHLKNFSLLFRDMDLSSVRHKNDLMDSVQEVLSKKKEGEWLSAGGLERSLMDSLTRSDLDSVSRDNPLILFTVDMSSAITNSMALEQSGIDGARKDPLGGTIEKDVYNQPNGILHGRAVGLVTGQIPLDNVKKVDTALERGMNKILSHGITTFCDYSPDAASSSMINLMKLMRKKRLKGMVVFTMGDRETARLADIGMTSLFGGEHLRLGGLAVIIDGSFSSLTGYMSKPYRGSESHGMLLMDEKELYSLLKRNYSHYIWAAVHCAGDMANEIALRVFEKISNEVGMPKLPMRIEQAQFLKDKDVEQFSLTGVIAVMNTIQIPVNRARVIKHLGPDSNLLSRLGSLVASGAKIAISSNAPEFTINPFHGLYCAVERKGFEEGPELRFYPKESISLTDAVYAYTMGGAMACEMEKDIGSIEAGKSADLIHLSKDIFKEGTGKLWETEVLATFVGGEMVYEKKLS
ncbi:MAG: amidohydrolase [Spirochaetes bacterium]|nr:amidohydrolase [Spirochaetota bacterium]